MMKPTIHLNGTSLASLQAENEKARYALMSAREALMDAAPNARDYYLQGPAAFGIASGEHLDRLNAIRKALRELEEIAEHLEEQDFLRRKP